ncbi:MAG: response regulator [Pseudomonadota bacterium]
MSNAVEKLGELVAWTIDDSEFDRKLNRRVLSRSGSFAHIFDFPSAQDALDELREIKVFPHVIFLDVMMPVKNGFDFLAEATEEFGDNFNSRVVIMLTSSLNPDDRSRAESYSAVREFLSKPLTINDVQTIASRTSQSLEQTRH